MDSVTFQLDGSAHVCRIRVSERARRVSLRVTDDGVEIVRPVRVHTFTPEPLLIRFSPWIRRQLDRRKTRLEQARALEGRLLLRGREMRLEYRTDLFSSVREEGQRLVVSSARAEQAPEVLRSWLFDQARQDFFTALTRRSSEMNQPYGRFQVRDQKWLWGSCSPASGTVSLNARLVMAPPDVLDYIVVHELAHFRWRGHGIRFWELVRRHRAAAREHRRWLRENLARLQFPGVIPALDNATV